MEVFKLLLAVAIVILACRVSFCIRFKGFRLCVGSQCSFCRHSHYEVFLADGRPIETKDGILKVKSDNHCHDNFKSDAVNLDVKSDDVKSDDVKSDAI